MQSFFKNIFDKNVYGYDIPNFDASALRIELFKFNYPKTNFDLNQKADSNEAFLFLLDELHQGYKNQG